MKNLLSIIALLFIIIANTNAQSEIVDLKKTKSFEFAHKTQPIQLATLNMKYAFEFSMTERLSLELEGNVRPKSRGFFVPRYMDNTTYYGQIRIKDYFAGRDGKKLTGLYYAPVLSVGTSHKIISDGWGGFAVGGKRNEFISTSIDLGYQKKIGNVVVDLFSGLGFTYNTINKSIGYNNSHTNMGGVAARLGIRLGIGHN